MNRTEEDLLNPQEQKAKFLEMDNSLVIGNDHLRNSNNSFHMTNTTNRSLLRNNDDSISCSSENNHNDSSYKLKYGEFAHESMRERLNHPDPQLEPKAKAEWYHAQGFEARKKGNFQLAIEYYTKALEIIPTHFKVIIKHTFSTWLMLF